MICVGQCRATCKVVHTVHTPTKGAIMRTIRRQHYKDYASDAFRVLGKYGSADAYRERVLAAIEQRRADLGTRIDAPIGSPTEAAIIRAEEAIDEAKATLADIEAAEKALQICAVRDQKQNTRIVTSVKAVYMLDRDRLPSHHEIMETVIACSIIVPCDRATIYRWLGFARTVFARERGLRIKD